MMETIVNLATQIGYDRFHPDWFINNKLEPKTELLEMVLLQKWIREEHYIDIIVTSELIGYGYLLYYRYPPKNLTNKFIFKTYEESLKEGIKFTLKTLEKLYNLPLVISRWWNSLTDIQKQNEANIMFNPDKEWRSLDDLDLTDNRIAILYKNRHDL